MLTHLLKLDYAYTLHAQRQTRTGFSGHSTSRSSGCTIPSSGDFSCWFKAITYCDTSVKRIRPYVLQDFRKQLFSSIQKVWHPGKKATVKLITELFVWKTWRDTLHDGLATASAASKWRSAGTTKRPCKCLNCLSAWAHKHQHHFLTCIHRLMASSNTNIRYNRVNSCIGATTWLFTLRCLII